MLLVWGTVGRPLFLGRYGDEEEVPHPVSLARLLLLMLLLQLLLQMLLLLMALLRCCFLGPEGSNRVQELLRGGKPQTRLLHAAGHLLLVIQQRQQQMGNSTVWGEGRSCRDSKKRQGDSALVRR